jgi:hypothetical protein
LIGLLPKSAVVVSQCPSLWRFRRERRSYRAIVQVLLEARHLGVVTCHVSVRVNCAHMG